MCKVSNVTGVMSMNESVIAQVHAAGTATAAATRCSGPRGG